ncbi:MAG TPA: hypothetical protein DFS52_27590, partial [Myxococcales bacterium]|nr:hypothetical protein [Myxococcales bacterium]
LASLAPRPEPAAQPATKLGPPANFDAVWRELVAALRGQKRELLASAMAHGRVLAVSTGRVRIGYAPDCGMFRRQAERMQKDAEAVLSTILGEPTTLSIEGVSADDEVRSIAEAESERQREREARILREARECPAVLAAMRIFQGTIEQIRVLEPPEEPEGFSDEAEEAGDP